ncbi:hypothetical protein IKE13_01665 [Candidatus Saccharibacteria bacterium]|nr:hypothetical protein [Candidatus Saccharibacteria bacterium]
MQGQEYLDQISAQVRPVKSTKPGIMGSKFFMIGMVGLIALVVIIIIGAILGGNKGGEKNLSYKLKLHLDNTASVISEYQPRVKSSDLRSHSASLYSVLSSTNRELTDYLTEKYNFKEKDINKDFVEEATLAMDGLEAELFEARINGNLDRIYAHKMTYEISLFMNEEAKLINSTSNASYKEILTRSYNSLSNLYDSFNSFSETK